MTTDSGTPGYTGVPMVTSTATVIAPCHGIWHDFNKLWQGSLILCGRWKVLRRADCSRYWDSSVAIWGPLVVTSVGVEAGISWEVSQCHPTSGGPTPTHGHYWHLLVWQWMFSVKRMGPWKLHFMFNADISLINVSIWHGSGVHLFVTTPVTDCKSL